jgi:hypothetical protein
LDEEEEVSKRSFLVKEEVEKGPSLGGYLRLL